MKRKIIKMKDSHYLAIPPVIAERLGEEVDVELVEFKGSTVILKISKV